MRSFLPLLALPALAFAQSSTASSNATSTAASPSSTSSGSVTAQTAVVLHAAGTNVEGTNNSTVTAVWSTDGGKGALTQGLTLLQNSTGTAANDTVYGVALRFNATQAVSVEENRTTIPWIAYISCDSSYAVISPSNTSSSANSTTSATSSSSAASASASASVNGTSSTNTSSLETLDIIARAQDLGASAVVLYSQTTQSCILNSTSNSTSASSSNITLPIFTSPTTQIANLLVAQFNNLPSDHVYFNSTLLTLSTANLTSVLTSAGSVSNLAATLTTPINYILAQLVPSYSTNSSDNGAVGTIGRASPTGSAGATASATVGAGAGGSSAAAPRFGLGGQAVFGVVGGAVLAGLAVLV